MSEYALRGEPGKSIVFPITPAFVLSKAMEAGWLADWDSLYVLNSASKSQFNPTHAPLLGLPHQGQSGGGSVVDQGRTMQQITALQSSVVDQGRTMVDARTVQAQLHPGTALVQHEEQQHSTTPATATNNNAAPSTPGPGPSPGAGTSPSTPRMQVLNRGIVPRQSGGEIPPNTSGSPSGPAEARSPARAGEVDVALLVQNQENALDQELYGPHDTGNGVGHATETREGVGQ